MGSPVALSRPTVFTALATPAQLTQIRSWPCASRALAKPAATASSEVTSTWAKMPADLRRDPLAFLGVAVEHGDLDAPFGKRPGGRLAEAGGGAGDDCGDIGS